MLRTLLILSIVFISSCSENPEIREGPFEAIKLKTYLDQKSNRWFEVVSAIDQPLKSAVLADIEERKIVWSVRFLPDFESSKFAYADANGIAFVRQPPVPLVKGRKYYLTVYSGLQRQGHLSFTH